MADFWNSAGCYLTDEFYFTDNETYLRMPLVGGSMPYNNGVSKYPLTGNVQKSNPVNGRVAAFIHEADSSSPYAYISTEVGSIDFGPEIGFVNVTCSFTYEDLSYDPPIRFQSYGMPAGDGIGLNIGSIAMNIPVFSTKEEAVDYIVTGENKDHALNYRATSVEPETTNTYYCFNSYAEGTQTNGEMVKDSASNMAYDNIIVQSNTRPVLYFDENYRLNAVYSDVVSWYGNAVDEDISMVPVSSYIPGSPSGHNIFYGDVNAYAKAKKAILPDGTYYYGFKFLTDFAIFGDYETALYALRTGDYTQAANWPSISGGGDEYEVLTGDEEAETTFGEGSFVSPFIQTYICSQAAVREVAEAFYTDDPSLIENIKKGLELFGASPFEAIVGLSAFPFDVSTMVNTSPWTYIYFGSYQKTLQNTVYKVINMAHKFIDAGGVFLKPIFNNFRDFEPWTSLHVYLPFVGWQKLDIATYINKYVSIRYYVDIMTRTGVAVLLADGVMCDYFTTGGLGVELPITGQNLSRYANDTLNALLQGGGGIVSGAVSGAVTGSIIPGVGTVAGAVAGAALSGGVGLAAGVFQMSQKPKPKDQNMTKGNFSGGTGCYMPYYVTFRFDVHDVIEPSNLNALYGKPSNYGGKLKGLSGFVKAETIKMNTSGMSDEEISEIVSLLNAGIFV